jgi:hypothetical protein
VVQWSNYLLRGAAAAAVLAGSWFLLLHADDEAQLQGYQIINRRSSSTDFVHKSSYGVATIDHHIYLDHILEFVLQSSK